MGEDYKQQINQVYSQVHLLVMQYSQLTIEHVLFTWRWWFLVLITIVPWIIWWNLRKKDSTSLLICAALMVSTVSNFLDFLGIAYNLWSYYVNYGLPLPPLFAWNFTLIPIATMVLLQYRKISPFFKSLIFATLIAFVGEPLMTWMQFYNPHNWSYIYSFPIYLLIYLLAEFIVSRKSYNAL